MKKTYTVSVKHMRTGRILRLMVLSSDAASAMLACNRSMNPCDRPFVECEFVAFGAEVAA